MQLFLKKCVDIENTQWYTASVKGKPETKNFKIKCVLKGNTKGGEVMKRKKPIINYYIIVINGGQEDEHDTLYKVLTLLVSIASLVVAIVLR